MCYIEQFVVTNGKFSSDISLCVNDYFSVLSLEQLHTTSNKFQMKQKVFSIAKYLDLGHNNYFLLDHM